MKLHSDYVASNDKSRMQKPSILFINRVYPPVRGATGRMLHDLAGAFVKAGWSVTVLTAGEKAEKYKDDQGVNVHRVQVNMDKKNATAYMLVWLKLFFAAMFLKKHQLVVSKTDPPLLAYLGHLVSVKMKAAHIHWCQDVYPDLFPVLRIKLPKFVYRFMKKLSHHALLECERVVVIGRCMARHLITDKIPARKISVIPNWHNPCLDSRSIKARQDAESVFGGNSQFKKTLFNDDTPKFRVLYAGNLGWAHPIQTILGAAYYLNEDYPEIEFVFIGDGAGHERLAKERARLNLHNIRLLPFQPEENLRDVLESGDIHLVSLRDNACGLMVPCKAYSALAVARPLIFLGPEHSEVGRLIQDFKTGHIVPQGQARQLAKTIRHYRQNGEVWYNAHNAAAKTARFMRPEESYQAWIERAHETIGDQFSASNVRKKIRREAA